MKTNSKWLLTVIIVAVLVPLTARTQTNVLWTNPITVTLPPTNTMVWATNLPASFLTNMGLQVRMMMVPITNQPVLAVDVTYSFSDGPDWFADARKIYDGTKFELLTNGMWVARIPWDGGWYIHHAKSLRNAKDFTADRAVEYAQKKDLQ